MKLLLMLCVLPCQHTRNKVLAVGCSDGSVCLYSVEDGHALHNFFAGAPITHLCWGQLSEDWYMNMCSTSIIISVV